MNDLVVITAVAWLAGIAAFAGGTIAHFEGSAESEQKKEIIHGIVAFGGGILLAAVAFALTPTGIAELPTPLLAVSFIAGGLIFCGMDAYISKKEGSKAQFMAMLLDFIPEALALGALFAHSPSSGMLLALFIGAQNLPEGFNAHRESVAAGIKPKASLYTLLGVSTLGPLCAAAGYFFLSDLEMLNACIMTAAGGGILYLVFQDIAPQAKLQRHWAPPLGAVLGFVVGMVAHQLLG